MACFFFLGAIQPHLSIFDMLENQSQAQNIDQEEMIEQVENQDAEPQPLPLSAEKTPNEWNLVQIFPDKKSCDDFINQEGFWKEQRNRNTTNGIKTMYRCHVAKTRGQQCSAGLYTKHSMTPDDASYHLYKTISNHNHENLPIRHKVLPDDVKQLIRDYVNDGLTLKAILMRFRAKNDIVQPEKNQVKNFIKTYRKQLYGEAKVNIEDMVLFCNQHKTLPDDLDTAFVLSIEHSPLNEEPIDIDEYDSEDEIEVPILWIRFIVTTRRLLENAAKSKNIRADATHKMIVQNYPVLGFGASDLHAEPQRFHLIAMMVSKFERTDDFAFGFSAIKDGIQQVSNSTIAFEPSYLMADAGGAIHAGGKKAFGEQLTVLMCYVHVKRAIDRRAINKPKNKPLIKADLDHLSLAYDKKTFNTGCELLLAKWQEEEEQFVDYFKSTWIDHNEKWYVGAGIGISNDNNLLESFFGNVKIHQTFFRRKGINEFKERLLNIVSDRSREYLMDKAAFENDVTITNRAKKAALGLSKSKSILHRRQDDGSVHIYMKKGDNIEKLENDEVDAILNAEFETFDEFVEHMFDLYIIKFDNEVANWKKSTCSCPAFAGPLQM